jgi:hypothetical protein
MSFFADAYPRQIDVLTHISPFWRTYESNDSYFQYKQGALKQALKEHYYRPFSSFLPIGYNKCSGYALQAV